MERVGYVGRVAATSSEPAAIPRDGGLNSIPPKRAIAHVLLGDCLVCDGAFHD